MAFFNNLLDLLLEASPWLILGLALGGMIKALIPSHFLNKHLSSNSIGTIGKAALLGAPLPLCSCGVIPVALGLRQAGASKSATTSFLVSTPETGIDSITVTYALLGPFMTVVRPIAALSSAFIAGLLVIFFDKEDPQKPSHLPCSSEKEADTTSSHCHSESAESNPCCSGTEVAETDYCSGESDSAEPLKKMTPISRSNGNSGGNNKQTQQVTYHCNSEQEAPESKTTKYCSSESAEHTTVATSSCCGSTSNQSSSNNPFINKAWQGVRYAFTSLLDDIIFWLMIGMIFAALANTFLPTDFLVQWGRGIIAMIVIMLAGIPMYICATASTPVAAGLMMAGVSPGVALVLMLTGPATNVSTLGVIHKEMGKKTMWLYLLGVSVTALIAGVIVNAIVDSYNINITTQLQEHGQIVAPIQWASLLLLVGITTRKFIFRNSA